VGALELNVELSRHCFKSGEIGNPSGKQGSPALRIAYHSFKKILRTAVNEYSTMPGREGLSVFESLARTAIQCAEAGDFQFMKFIVERLDGRIPLHIDMQQETTHVFADSLKAATTAELQQALESIENLERACKERHAQPRDDDDDSEWVLVEPLSREEREQLKAGTEPEVNTNVSAAEVTSSARAQVAREGQETSTLTSQNSGK
jgi:hypothetical protein